MTSLVDATPPVDTTLEQIYRIDLPTADWLQCLRNLVPFGTQSAAVLYRFNEGAAEALEVSASLEVAGLLRQSWAPTETGALRMPIAFREPVTKLQSELMGSYLLPSPYAAIYASMGGSDCWAFGGASVCGVGVGVGCSLRHRGRLSQRATTYWTSVATHLTAAARLRTAMHAPSEAVLSPDGDVLHAEGIARDRENREALRRATKAMRKLGMRSRLELVAKGLAS